MFIVVDDRDYLTKFGAVMGYCEDILQWLVLLAGNFVFKCKFSNFFKKKKCPWHSGI